MVIGVDMNVRQAGFFSALEENFPQHKIVRLKIPPARSKFGSYYRTQFKIPNYLKKIRADVFISDNSICYRARLPQILLVNNVNGALSRSFAKFISKATKIIASSENIRQHVIRKYKTDINKIVVLDNFAPVSYKPQGEEKKNAVKESYTDGKEFFLYSGDLGDTKNLINILKAFSLFKKRQKSNMQILITGAMDEKFEELKKQVETYKYKGHVRLAGDIDLQALTEITASAYATLYPVVVETWEPIAMESMQCEVPVITNLSPGLPEPCLSAVLRADPNDPADIAEKMMILFKDEKKRSELIDAGKIAVAAYTKDKTAAQIAGILSLVKA